MVALLGKESIRNFDKASAPCALARGKFAASIICKITELCGSYLGRHDVPSD